jgi:hypothetical protein
MRCFNLLGISDLEGHHLAYDEKATQDPVRRADAFLAAHMPSK